MPDVPVSSRPYIVLRSRFDDGVYEYVATIDAGDADRAIRQARETVVAHPPLLAEPTYRDEWHAVPERNWTSLAATDETVPKTTWSQGTLPGSTDDSRPAEVVS